MSTCKNYHYSWFQNDRPTCKMPRLVMVFIQTRSKPNLEKEMSEFVLAGVAAHSASSLLSRKGVVLFGSALQVNTITKLCARQVGPWFWTTWRVDELHTTVYLAMPVPWEALIPFGMFNSSCRWFVKFFYRTFDGHVHNCWHTDERYTAGSERRQSTSFWPSQFVSYN